MQTGSCANDNELAGSDLFWPNWVAKSLSQPDLHSSLPSSPKALLSFIVMFLKDYIYTVITSEHSRLNWWASIPSGTVQHSCYDQNRSFPGFGSSLTSKRNPPLAEFCLLTWSKFQIVFHQADNWCSHKHQCSFICWLMSNKTECASLLHLAAQVSLQPGESDFNQGNVFISITFSLVNVRDQQHWLKLASISSGYL